MGKNTDLVFVFVFLVSYCYSMIYGNYKIGNLSHNWHFDQIIVGHIYVTKIFIFEGHQNITLGNLKGSFIQ
jgi:hypothetical protein